MHQLLLRNNSNESHTSNRVIFSESKENLMTVILETPTEVETEIASEAAQKGMPLPDYLLTVIQERKIKYSEGMETYLLSESALAKDWLRPEEDEAWRDL